MSKVFKYRSWVKRLPTDRDWTRCIGHITLQENENIQEIGRAAINDILERGHQETMFIYRLQITKEDTK